MPQKSIFLIPVSLHFWKRTIPQRSSFSCLKYIQRNSMWHERPFVRRWEVCLFSLKVYLSLKLELWNSNHRMGPLRAAIGKFIVWSAEWNNIWGLVCHTNYISTLHYRHYWYSEQTERVDREQSRLGRWADDEQMCSHAFIYENGCTFLFIGWWKVLLRCIQLDAERLPSELETRESKEGGDIGLMATRSGWHKYSHTHGHRLTGSVTSLLIRLKEILARVWSLKCNYRERERDFSHWSQRKSNNSSITRFGWEAENGEKDGGWWVSDGQRQLYGSWKSGKNIKWEKV